MKLLVLLTFYLLLAFSTHAQALSWLHGDWTGETYFPNGPITKRIIVKLRIIKVTGNHFEAFLDNLYPNDTTIRLERKITGNIIDKKMHIVNSEQVYIRDLRTQNFWRNCTGCDIQSAFSIGNEQVEIKLKTTNCSDECNGETTFSRDTSELNPTQQKDLVKWFRLPVSQPVGGANKTQAKDSSAITAKLPEQEAATNIVQEQKTDAESNTASASKMSAHVVNGSLQEQKRNIIDSSSNRQQTPTEMEHTGDEQLEKSVSGRSQAIGNSDLPSFVKSQKATSYKLSAKDSSLASKSPVQKKLVSRLAQKKDSLVATALNQAQAGKDNLTKVKISKADSTSNALTTRTTNLVTTFQVTSPHIVIQLFDNAEIDGDVVTVYHNGQMIVNRQSLTHKAITITIDASKENAHHEFVMTADNLGLIPPNTALMRIAAGQQKFELEVSSDFDNNSKIKIDYTGE